MVLKSGKIQIGVYVTPDIHDRWAQTGMKAPFVFERGLNAGNLEKEITEKNQTIQRLEKAIFTIQQNSLELDEDIRKLKIANEMLQLENAKLKLEKS